MRRWLWTTAIALFFAIAHAVGLLPAILRVPSNVIGRPLPDWSLARTASVTLVSLVTGYCFLVSLGVAERGAAHRLPPVGRYLAAGAVACAIAILLEMVLYVLVPSFAPYLGGWTLLQDPQHLLGRIVWSAAGFGLSGGLAVAVYVRFRSAQFARETFNAAELERVEASRAVLASQLAALQARVEPRFLLSTLAQVEGLYDHDPKAGDRMLDELIAYLRAALPQLRSERSTLKQEVQLAESYLRIVQIRMGSRLGWRLDVEPGLDNCDFPPMMLLPLIDEALRNGLEPLPHGGTITLAAEADRDRLRFRISDDGLQRTASPSNGLTMATLCDRLDGLYGATARFGSTFNAAQGIVTTIEVPLAAASINR